MLVEILNKKLDLEVKKLKESINIRDYEFFLIKEIGFEGEYPRKEAIENLLGSFRSGSLNFLYLIVGEKERVYFYLGVSKNIHNKNLKIDIDDVAKYFLDSNIKANFRGSKIKKLNHNEKIDLKDKLENFNYTNLIDGIVDENETAKKFQGIDRLVDAMLRNEFALLVVANPFEIEEIEEIEKKLYLIYDKISPLVKKSIQKNITKSKNEVVAFSENESDSNSSSNSTSKVESVVEGSATTENENKKSATKSKNKTISKNESNTTSKSISKTKSKTTSTNDSDSESEVINIEFEKKEYEEILKYIDEVLLKRVFYMKKGGFKSSIYLFTNTKGELFKITNLFLSLFNKTEFNKSPLKSKTIKSKSHILEEFRYAKNFQIPFYEEYKNENEFLRDVFYSKYKGNSFLTSKELSVVTSLPQKEIIGLSLNEYVEFGLNVKSEGDFVLGKLLKDKQITNIDIKLSKDDINKHIFITGVTGSGKTTTCHKILYESKMPFLVIEPAKKEYRKLAEIDDVLVFTFSDENIAPFRMNPFELFENESISSRVDMIKAAIESSFDLEAAMPQIIERAIYKSYEDCGWDIQTGINFKDKEFPTLEDVIKNVEIIVDDEKFDERLRNDYIASINARLKGLLVGSKGFMLNCKKGFDIEKLLYKKVIIELEEVKNPAEKSFIMGLLLLNINEALKRIHKKNPNFRHITLIEEAHRLLSKYEIGDSLNKKRGVEVFTDMLAEVRKYGEGLIIVDQIPNKLTPEILKNTNTKIVHRIFASDDKEAIGNSMALNNEQKEYLSKLEVGEAVMFSQNFQKAISLKIEQLKDIKTSDNDIDDKILRYKWLNFYKKEFNLDISIDKLDKMLTIKNIFNLLKKSNEKLSKKILEKIKEFIKEFRLDSEEVASFLKDEEYKKETLLKFLKGE